MRYRDYIRATNLRLRIAYRVLGETHCATEKDKRRRMEIGLLMDEWIAELEDREKFEASPES